MTGPWTVLIFALAAPPGKGMPAPRFERGQEIPFAGETVDSSDRPGQKYRNAYDVNVRWFVLDTNENRTDLAVLTAVTPKADRAIAAAARTISGEVVAASKTAARVDFVRIDKAGNASRLTVPTTPPPYQFSLDHRTEPLPDAPSDGPAFAEFGPFVPSKLGADGTGRAWTRQPDELWNGSRAIDLVGLRATKDYDDLAAAVAGCRRTERFYVSPTDGLPRAYARRIELREGKFVVQTVETHLEMKAPAPTGDAATYRHIRREAETAVWFAAEAERIRALGLKSDPKMVAALKARAIRFLADHQPPTAFRPAVEAATGP